MCNTNAAGYSKQNKNHFTADYLLPFLIRVAPCQLTILKKDIFSDEQKKVSLLCIQYTPQLEAWEVYD